MEAKDIKQVALIAITFSRMCIIHNFATQIQKVKDSTLFLRSLQLSVSSDYNW